MTSTLIRTAPWHAAALPIGTTVALGAELWMRTHGHQDPPAQPAGRRPWYATGETGHCRTDDEHVDGLLAGGAIVVAPDGTQRNPMLETLTAAVAWLYRTAQPDTAVVTHLGAPVGARRVGNRLVRLSPSGNPVVVVKVAEPRWTPLGDLRNGYGGPAERGAAIGLLTMVGATVVDRWNGCPASDSASYRLAGPIHPTLHAAVVRYQAGCPGHRSAFCGWQGATDAERACTWFAGAAATVVHPSWPGTAAPEPQGAPSGAHR